MEVEVNGCAPIGGEKATGAGDNGDIGFAFGGGAEEARNWVEKYDDSPRCLLSSISWRDTDALLDTRQASSTLFDCFWA